jgi:hypothetical protein
MERHPIRLFFSAAAAVALMLTSCGTEPGACTLDVQPAVTVRAFDAGTDENITDGARGTVSEGSYSDSLRRRSSTLRSGFCS